MPDRLRATERDLEVITRFHKVATFCARHSSHRAQCLERLLETASALVHADASALYVFDATPGDPAFMASQLDAAGAALLSAPPATAAAALVAQSLRDSHLFIRNAESVPDDAPAQLPWFEALRDAGVEAVVALPLRDSNETLLGLLAVFYQRDHQPSVPEFHILGLLARQTGDYLERYAIQQAVNVSEERFRRFMDATSDMVYRMNADWTEMRYLQGRNFVADTHAPTERWLASYVPKEDQPRVLAAVERAVAQKDVLELEHRVIRIDGSIGWTHTRAIPVLDDNGQLLEWFGAASDITSRKTAEHALRLSQQRYHTLFDSIDEGYCVIRMVFDAQGNGRDYFFLEVNQAFERHTGLSDPLGRSIRAMVPGHDEHWFHIYGEIAKTGESRRFDMPADAMGRHYDVYAFRIGPPEDAQVAVLFSDITERKRFEQSMREASQRKDEFLAVLAHELRNPLAPVRTGLSVLQLANGDPATTAKMLPLLQRQVDHMVRLVDDLLEVSRVSGGKVELRLEPVDVSTALRSAVETSRPLIDAGHHRLLLSLPGETLTVNADPVRLSQIIANLLNNSAKYTDEGGRIELRAERDGNDALIVVQDNGRGIAADMLPRIFDLFTQSPQTSGMAQGGIGIGLTLVRSLVEMQGGRVEAHSAGLGQGAVFTVRLPLLQARQATLEVPEPELSAGTASMRVLVVDDNLDAAEGLRLLLGLLGMEVRTAHDGASGLAAAAEFTPELVLLDIGMPDMDGYELARRLRAAHGAQCPTLVVVSGWGQPDDRQRSLEAGIDAHLVKPVGLEQLQEVLRNVQGG